MYPSQHDVQSMEVIHQLETLLANDFPSARSQLQRHISNSSSIQRRSASRISKPSSAGNSPQNYTRRRHTTSQTIPRQRRALYQQCLQTPPSSAQFPPSARPVSWHPSTMANPYLMPTYTTTYTQGLPTPQPTSTTPFTYKGWYNPEDPSGFYQQSSDYNLCRNSDIHMMQGNYRCQPEAVFSPVVYPSAMPGSLSTYATYTAPATPDFLALPEPSVPQRPMLPRTDSKELVGMGLYDGPDRNSWILDNYMDDTHTTRPLSLGKGLKLEETWEPPEDEDKTDDEEDLEEDQNEDTTQAQETIQEQLRLASQAPQIPPMTINNQPLLFDAQTYNVQAGFGHQMYYPSGMVL